MGCKTPRGPHLSSKCGALVVLVLCVAACIIYCMVSTYAVHSWAVPWQRLGQRD
jgi:hypothetical protein